MQIAQRLRNQLIERSRATTPHTVVARLGAIQAQDYLGALWAVGLRMRDAIEADVERAIEERRIVRCWPMRGTLHFVTAEDARWMIDLLAARVLTRHRKRLERDYGIDAPTLKRCRTIVTKALRDGRALTRPELYALFEKAGVAAGESRGLHILFTLAHERLICFGPRRGKQPAFVLFDEWLPDARPKPAEESLHELARRYFTSHGPATINDFVWWSGLTMKEAKQAMADLQFETSPVKSTGVHLLPPFDEYTVAYRDRDDIIAPQFAKKVNAGGGMLNAVIVIDGLVAGTWKRTLRGDAVHITMAPFRAFTPRELQQIEIVAARYATFLGKEKSVIS